MEVAEPPNEVRTSLPRTTDSDPTTVVALGVGGAERDDGGGDFVDRGDELGVDFGEA